MTLARGDVHRMARKPVALGCACHSIYCKVKKTLVTVPVVTRVILVGDSWRTYCQEILHITTYEVG